MDALGDFSPTIHPEPEEATMADVDVRNIPQTGYQSGDTMSEVSAGPTFSGSWTHPGDGSSYVHWNLAIEHHPTVPLNDGPTASLDALGFAQMMINSPQWIADGEPPTVLEAVQLMSDSGPIFGLPSYANMSVALADQIFTIDAPSTVQELSPSDSTEALIRRTLARKLHLPPTHSLCFTKSQDGTLRYALRDGTRFGGSLTFPKVDYLFHPVIAFQHTGDDSFAVSCWLMYEALVRNSGNPVGGTRLREHLGEFQRSGRPSLLANIMEASKIALNENPGIALISQAFQPFRPEMSVQLLQSWSNAVSSKAFLQAFERARRELSGTSKE